MSIILKFFRCNIHDSVYLWPNCEVHKIYTVQAVPVVFSAAPCSGPPQQIIWSMF